MQLPISEYLKGRNTFGFSHDLSLEAAVARRTHINVGQESGLRCRIGDEAAKRRFEREVGRVARRYPGGQMLGDIDIATGEFVYRATIPVESYAIVMAAVRRRKGWRI